ncbi:glycosyltransferase family 39 protein [Pseudolysinimonas kribbensis]|uniref:Mannosyltransferase n=1 Tax=Pseudolysinimonas kribbensis TaxID=433641 RepID=A0ABQ6K315_9MICO|nr:glycosyltransferase family 39 protein [Pseudolysinimonas kribbensis]GMA94126.1 mannosyltransferase [Pseudolysinimonas kribbensis]
MTTLGTQTVRPPAARPARSRWAAARAVLRRSTAARAASLGLVGGLIGWAGSGVPSYWGDEAASIMSAERSLPGLFAMAAHVDAVHTTYYALLHVWIRLVGTSELATRTPSAVAVAFLVAGVVVLGERLGGIRLGVAAGIAAVALPRITYLATDARSYAFAAAAAVWIAVLVVRLLRGRHRRRAWVLLGVAIGATAWMFLYAVLLVLVVGVMVLVLRRDLIRSWLWAGAAAVVVASPIALLAMSERHQIAFLAHRSVVSVGGVLVTQWFLKPWPAVVGWAIILAGVVLSLRRRRGRRAVLLGLTWMALPTAILLLADPVVPVYTTRYLSFAAPAVALLIGLGAVRIAESVRGRELRLAAGAAVLGIAAGVSAPVYLAQRGPYGQSEGADFEQAAEAAGDLGHRGDAVIFDEGTKPSIDPRLAYRLFPQRFTGLRDVELVTPFDRRTQLWDVVRPLDQALPDLGREVIAIENTAGHGLPPDIERLVGAGYRVDAVQRLHIDSVYRLTRPGA